MSHIKKAITFGNTRTILTKLKERGYTLTRRPVSSNVDTNKKIINIFKKPKESNPFSDLYESVESKANPRVKLLHEFGHSLDKNLNKKVNDGNERPRYLKRERIANKNALNYIKDKLSRKDYLKQTNEGYKSYKKEVVDDELLGIATNLGKTGQPLPKNPNKVIRDTFRKRKSKRYDRTIRTAFKKKHWIQ